MNRAWVKVLRDLRATWLRTAFMILALATGLASLGAVLGMRAVIGREMNREYLDTVPASATIDVGPRGLSDGLLAELRSRPEVAVAERRATREVRWRHRGGRWGRGLLFVVEDLESQGLALVEHASGARVPGPGEVLVERSALQVIGLEPSLELDVDGRVRAVSVVGVVHEPALAPAVTEQAAYLYVTPATWALLAERPILDEVRVLVAEEPLDAAAVRQQVETTAAWLVTQGVEVHEVRVPPPGKHPHQRPSEAILLLFALFSGLTVVLAGILSASLLAITLARQAREVAVMKALGATRGRIGATVAASLLVVAVAALALAAVPAVVLGRAGVDAVMGLLNLDVESYALPASSVAGWVAFGLVLPLVTGGPVIARAMRVSVLEAMNEHGARVGPRAPAWLPRVGDRLVATALRNALRVPRRFALTVALLAVGGGLFVTARSVEDAWATTVRRVLVDRRFDLEVVLGEPGGTLSLDPSWRVERWASVPVSMASASGLPVSMTWPDGGHGSFALVGVPADQRLVRFPLLDGRLPQAPGEIALNQVAAARVGGTRAIGHPLTLVVEGRPTRWQVVGIVEEVASPATAYVDLQAFGAQTGLPATTLRIATGAASFADTRRAAGEVEAAVERSGGRVARVVPIELLFNAMGEHVLVLVQALSGLAVMMAAVGVLALAANTSASIAERSREIGVLRAIGARPSQVWRMILFEGWFTTAVSVPLALVVALPTSMLVGRVVGRLAFELPLPLDLSWTAWLGWACVTLGVSTVSSLLPALAATRGTVRETLG